jgi:predicted ferric reductase
MSKINKWMDRLVIGFSLLVIGLSAWSMMRNDIFTYPLYADDKLAWHLIRSTGIVAYALLMASTIWGLFLSSQLVKDWSPGTISMTLHSTISWLALLLGVGHGLLLLFDDYFTYTLNSIFVPFSGPYRPEFVGLGTFAFWLLVIVTLSFPARKYLGSTLWKRLHYMSYVAFALVSAHGIFAGTDGEAAGFRMLVGGGVLVVVMLLGVRLGQDQGKSGQRSVPTRAVNKLS